MDTTIDPKTGNDLAAQNLAKAIRQRESKGDFNAVGDAGTSHGGYQFQSGTWKTYAKDVLGDSNAEMTPSNQNAVAYGKIKKWKDDGKSAAEIAAMWNAGEAIGDKWTTHIGDTKINGKVIHYDTPQYVKDVTDLYQQYKGQQPSGYVTSINTPSEEPTFTEKKPTLAGSAIRGVLKTPAKVATSLVQAGQVAMGKPVTEPLSGGYLGRVEPLGGGLEGTTGRMVKEGVGAGLEAGGYLAGANAGKIFKGVKGLIKGADILESPAVVKNLKNIGLKNPVADLKAFNNAEKVEMLTEALKNAGTADRAVLQQALNKVLPQAIKEAGGKVAFSQAYPKLSTLLKLGKGLAKQAIAGTIIGSAINKGENIAGLIK